MAIGGIFGAYNAGYGIGFSGSGGTSGVSGADRPSVILNPGESTKVTPGHRSSPAECQTCKERKYKDGSNESDVSFQTAQHIDPSAAGARVRAHEQEHVSNAYEKASKGNGKVLQASVQIKTAICPECGRCYVAGGVTNTKISYPNEEENSYAKRRKQMDAALLPGMNFDKAV
ncbi:MAG: hypothetical protein K6B72_10540 [Lachnospiraceae bacterium]|nr:hypothetical protein [Lachnospiraceae bacterium]